MLTHHPAPGASRPDAPPRTPVRRPLAVLLVAAALAASQLACFGGARSQRDDPEPPPTHEPAAEVNVVTRLFGFEMSADSISAGPVTFVVENDDFLPHDFQITGNGVSAQTERLDPGESTTLTVDLAPGTYTYLCTVEGHSENMRGTLTVED